MRIAFLLLCSSLICISSLAASPAVEIEESAVGQQEIVGVGKHGLWQSQQIAPVTNDEVEHGRTDGRRSVDQIGCYEVRIRARRTGGTRSIARMEWCD